MLLIIVIIICICMILLIRSRNSTRHQLIRFEFFDHFGLGGEDMMNTKHRGGILIPDLAGMRAWFTLQHYKKFKGKFKPFT